MSASILSTIYNDIQLLGLQFFDIVEIANGMKTKGYSLYCILKRYQPLADIDCKTVEKLKELAFNLFALLDHNTFNENIFDYIDMIKDTFHTINFIDYSRNLSSKIIKRNHFAYIDIVHDSRNNKSGLFKFSLVPNIEISNIYLSYSKLNEILKNSDIRLNHIELVIEKCIKDFINFNYDEIKKQYEKYNDKKTLYHFIMFNKWFTDTYQKFCLQHPLFDSISNLIKPVDQYIEMRLFT